MGPGGVEAMTAPGPASPATTISAAAERNSGRFEGTIADPCPSDSEERSQNCRARRNRGDAEARCHGAAREGDPGGPGGHAIHDGAEAEDAQCGEVEPVEQFGE